MAEPSVIDRVRKALGRTGALTAAPTPPEILEPCARLVHSDIGLPELFAKRHLSAFTSAVIPESPTAPTPLPLPDTTLLRMVTLPP